MRQKVYVILDDAGKVTAAKLTKGSKNSAIKAGLGTSFVELMADNTIEGSHDANSSPDKRHTGTN